MLQVSIWQQFSSNHSGYFWVAGTFKTVEEARVAYDELRHILFEIDRWHREHKEESAAASEAGNYKALPPEAAFALQYNVQWPHTIDWTNFGDYWLEDWPGYETLRPAQERSRELIDEAVNIVGRVVIVSNPDQTWMTTQPFQSLLEHFGAATIGVDLDKLEGESHEDFELHAVVKFMAPSIETADNIENALHRYLTSLIILAPDDDLPPWHDDEANFREVLGKSSLLRPEDIQIIRDNWQRRFELHNRPTPSPYGMAMPAHRLALRDAGMTVARDGLKFTFTDIWFHNEELGLSALFAWLEVKGCSDIDFEYSTKPLPDEE